MTPFAAVILAHTDPDHLRRLVFALHDVPIVLHCDAKTPAAIFHRMITGLPARVNVARRARTSLASWSLVQAELDGLRAALAASNARHIGVLSGADFPLLPMAEISAELAKWEGRSWVWNVPLPLPDWNTPRHPDGGMWRLSRRFWTRGDQIVYWRNIPLRWPVKREIPTELTLRASSQWKIYARHHVQALLRLADDRPDLIRFWRTTLVPDESFAASMLASPALVGSDALAPCSASAWYLDWRNAPAGHPKWLSDGDFASIRAARRAQAIDPRQASGPVTSDPSAHRRLFARKFRSVDGNVVARIDRELRS